MWSEASPQLGAAFYLKCIIISYILLKKSPPFHGSFSAAVVECRIAAEPGRLGPWLRAASKEGLLTTADAGRVVALRLEAWPDAGSAAAPAEDEAAGASSGSSVGPEWESIGAAR